MIFIYSVHNPGGWFVHDKMSRDRVSDKKTLGSILKKKKITAKEGRFSNKRVAEEEESWPWFLWNYIHIHNINRPFSKMAAENSNALE